MPGAGRVLKEAETRFQNRPRHTQVLEERDSETHMPGAGSVLKEAETLTQKKT